MSKTYQQQIEASHPCHLDTDEAYKADNIAMLLVGERDSKRELVDLVRWLILDNAKTINPLPDTQEQGFREKYNELLYAVSTKYSGETRHETALRYIRQEETPKNNCASQEALYLEEIKE